MSTRHVIIRTPSGPFLCLAQQCSPSPSRPKPDRHDSSSIPHHLTGIVQERPNLAYYVGKLTRGAAVRVQPIGSGQSQQVRGTYDGFCDHSALRTKANTKVPG